MGSKRSIQVCQQMDGFIAYSYDPILLPCSRPSGGSMTAVASDDVLPGLPRFPLEGGTGAIWKAVARLLPQEKQVGTRRACSCITRGRRHMPPNAARVGSEILCTAVHTCLKCAACW